MALLFQKEWLTQPLGKAKPAAGVDVATSAANHNFSIVGAAVRSGPSGIKIGGDGSSAYATRDISLDSSPPFWFGFFGSRTGTPGSARYIYVFGDGSASAGAFAGLSIPSVGGGAISVSYRAATGTSVIQVGTTSSVIPINSDVCVVGVVPSLIASDAYLYVNGIKYNTSIGAASTSGSATYSKETIGALLRTTASNFSPYQAYAVARGRAISEEFAKYLSSNPWKFFAPRRIWVPQAAITGLPALSLPTYAPGSLTATGFRPRVTAT